MKVAIIMGSTSDLEIMSQAINVLEGFGVEVVKRVISAHRTPDLMCEFAKSAKANGIGPKTAARVILELKDKLMKENAGIDLGGDSATSAFLPAPGKKSVLSEAVDALLVLGYTRAEAMAALKELPTDTPLSLEDMIRAALKKLMKYSG